MNSPSTSTMRPAATEVAEATTMSVSVTATAELSVVVASAISLTPDSRGKPRLNGGRADQDIQAAWILICPDLVLLDHPNRKSE